MYRIKKGKGYGRIVANWHDADGTRHRKLFGDGVECARFLHFMRATRLVTTAARELDRAVHHTHRRHMERDSMAKQLRKILETPQGTQRAGSLITKT